jgi:cob(I)alamin adenosyltransferase
VGTFASRYHYRIILKRDTVVKIYTRTGDLGETGLLGGVRVKKHNPRIEAYGTVDELNAVLGVVRAAHPSQRVDQILEHIQNELFTVGAELATPAPKEVHSGRIEATHIERLEEMIDLCEGQLTPLKNFILPGGCPTAARLHYGRTVARRAERCVVELAESESVSPQIIVYLNRLSDLLFVLARFENARAGVPDIKWMSD